MPHRSLGEPTSSWRRPVVAVAASGRTGGLGAGREAVPGTDVSPVWSPQSHLSGTVLPLVLNGAAALVALVAAFAAARRRRRVASGPPAGAEIRHLAGREVERRRVRVAA